jgi:anti-anti-sigma factor
VQEIFHTLAGPDDLVLVVTSPRELGHEAADALRDCVVRNLPNRDGAGAVLDMQNVSMISSIGIAALLQIAEACKDRQARLFLAALSDRQLAFLKMLRLDRKFTFAPSLDDAIAGITQG